LTTAIHQNADGRTCTSLALLATPQRRADTVSQSPTPPEGFSSIPPEIQSLLRAAHRQHGDALAELRETLCGFVESQRARGTPLAEITAEVRRMMAQLTAAGGHERDAKHQARLVDSIIEWCGDRSRAVP
jgi:hypothetical protein